MTLDIQFKLKNNQNYTRYLRENSYWYKTLNRHPEAFKIFEEEVKTHYGLRPTDRLERAVEAFSLLQNVISTMK